MNNDPWTQCGDTLVSCAEDGRKFRLSDFTLEDEQNSCRFGVVQDATFSKTKMKLTLKLLNLNKFAKHQKKWLYEELALIDRIKHPAVLPYFGSFTEERRVVIMTQKTAHGDLKSLLCPKLMVDSFVAIGLFRDVVEGISFLHRQMIVHRNILPANIFVTNRDSDSSRRKGYSECFPYKAYITGFSCAAYIPQHPEVACCTKPSKCKLRMPSPTPHLDTPVDVWYLGVLLFQMLTGYVPFSDVTRSSEISSELPKLKSFRQMTLPLVESIIKTMSASDPLQRATLPEVRNKLKRIQNEIVKVYLKQNNIICSPDTLESTEDPSSSPVSSPERSEEKKKLKSYDKQSVSSASKEDPD